MKKTITGAKTPERVKYAKHIIAVVSKTVPDAANVSVIIHSGTDFAVNVELTQYAVIGFTVDRRGDNYSATMPKYTFENAHERESFQAIKAAFNGDVPRRANPAHKHHYLVLVKTGHKTPAYFWTGAGWDDDKRRAAIYADKANAEKTHFISPPSGFSVAVLTESGEPAAPRAKNPRAKNPTRKPERWYHKDDDGHYVISDEPYWSLAKTSSTEYGAKTLADLKRTYKGVTLKASWGESPDSPKK